MDDHSLDRVKQVFEQWSLYDLIIHHNYMRHTELVTCLNEFVKQTASWKRTGNFYGLIWHALLPRLAISMSMRWRTISVMIGKH